MRPILLLSTIALAACQAQDGAGAPGTSAQGFDRIDADETVHFAGTEPFWSGSVTGERMTYQTPDDIEGRTFAVKRFQGQGGLGYSGQLQSSSFDLMVTPGQCSDGMSDRSFPYTVTLQIGMDTRKGCAWTDAEPFKEDELP